LSVELAVAKLYLSMALTKCKECGNQISTKAVSCPKCGAPLQKKTSSSGCLGVGILVLIIFGAIGHFTRPGSDSSPNATDSAPATRRAYPTQNDVDAQPRRKALIDQGLATGVLMKWEIDSVQVGRGYYLLTFDQKKTLIEMIWKYYSVHMGDEFVTLNVYDGMSGKKVGSCWKRGFTPE
jgi:hypothetical protein